MFGPYTCIANSSTKATSWRSEFYLHHCDTTQHRERLHLQHYSRKRRRSQVHNSPGCQQRCLRSPTPASDGTSSQIGGRRTGGTPQNTACTPGMKTHRTITDWKIVCFYGRHCWFHQANLCLVLPFVIISQKKILLRLQYINLSHEIMTCKNNPDTHNMHF